MAEPRSQRWELRVVLVDDDVHLLELLSEVLGDHGVHVVEIATDGDEASAAYDRAIRQGTVDAVVMDQRMRRMDGLTATRHLRERYGDVLVIMHSAFAGQLGDGPQQAGVAAQVAKGSSPAELATAIRDVFESAHRVSQADRACLGVHRDGRAHAQA